MEQSHRLRGRERIRVKRGTTSSASSASSAIRLPVEILDKILGFAGCADDRRRITGVVYYKYLGIYDLIGRFERVFLRRFSHQYFLHKKWVPPVYSLLRLGPVIVPITLYVLPVVRWGDRTLSQYYYYQFDGGHIFAEKSSIDHDDDTLAFRRGYLQYDDRRVHLLSSMPRKSGEYYASNIRHTFFEILLR